jgi:hypothetical protein
MTDYDDGYNPAEGELIAEQLRHTIDLLNAKIESLAKELEHQKELSSHRLHSLEESQKDHETRIRGLQDGVTSFRVWSGLANGGASIMSIIAFIKAFIGG